MLVLILIATEIGVVISSDRRGWSPCPEGSGFRDGLADFLIKSDGLNDQLTRMAEILPWVGRFGSGGKSWGRGDVACPVEAF